MESSASHVVGQPRCHHDADTGHMSCSGLLPIRDSAFTVTAPPLRHNQPRYMFRAGVYCLWMGNFRNLDLLLFPIFPAATGQQSFTYVRLLCSCGNSRCICRYHHWSIASGSPPRVGYNVVAHFFLYRDYTPRHSTCISDLLGSDICEHDIHNVGYRYELSCRYYHHE